MKKLESGTNNVVEVHVALMAERFCQQMGVRELHLEGDPLVIIHAIMKGSIDVWHLQNSILNIVEDLNNFEDFRISNIKRMGNMEANVLSKWVLGFNEIGEVIIEDMRQLNFED